MRSDPTSTNVNRPLNQGSNKGRWVVVHDGWRDQYQLPAAFAESRLLERFVTDWYTSDDHPIWSRLMRSSLGRVVPQGFRGRSSLMVSSKATADSKARFLLGMARRKLRHEPYDDVVEGIESGRHAAEIARSTRSHLLATSYSAASAFERLGPGLARVLFQVHPQPRFLRELYVRQMAEDINYIGLHAEAEFGVDEREMSAWEREASLADHIICASSFTKRSLLWSGISPDRVSVVPYGVSSEHFQYSAQTDQPKFRVLFVGQRVARKGLRGLLKVWKKLNPQNAELILAGGHQSTNEVLAGFEGLYTDIPRMDKASLVRLYQSCDVMALPSLAEGFGHVYLESLACGTPVLSTINTGGQDIVTHGHDGWTIPAGDEDALEEQLTWLLEHRDEVRSMRSAARACAERYSWPLFRTSVKQIACSVAETIESRTSVPRQSSDSAEIQAVRSVGAC